LPIPAEAMANLFKELNLTTHTFSNGMTAAEVLSSENPVILKYRFL
jgi:hypothetical protein